MSAASRSVSGVTRKQTSREDLDVDAAQAERDQRAEERILRHADHDLDAARDHRLHQDAVHGVELAC